MQQVTVIFSSATGLLSSFVEVESIKRHFKSRLVGTVLNGYLCLRKLVVQRTKLIDETQDMLLEMLEDMTTGLNIHVKHGHVQTSALPLSFSISRDMYSNNIKPLILLISCR